MTVWGFWLLYFWVSLLALCISPFLFNPHQFAWNDFFIDYRDYLRWLSRGNSRSHGSSWIGFCRLSRTRITGYKRKQLGEPSSKNSGDAPRARFRNLIWSEVLGPLVLVAVTLVPYLYINAQTGVEASNNKGKPPPGPTSALIRVAIVAFAPIGINAGVLLGFFAMACCMGPILSMCCKKFGSVLAAIAHGISVVVLIVFFEVMFALEAWSFSKTLIGMITVMMIQRFIYKLIVALALTREFKSDSANIAWWTGKWYAMGWHTVSQPGREFLCKITELGMFAGDFILGHLLLFLMLPALLIPYIDKLHSIQLFWLRPSRQIRPPIYSLKQSKLRKRRVVRYAILYFFMLIVFIALIAGPIVAGKYLPSFSKQTTQGSIVLAQPTGYNHNDTSGEQTGTAAAGGGGGATGTGASPAATSGGGYGIYKRDLVFY